MRLCCAVLAFMALSVSKAGAQDHWVFVPVLSGSEPESTPNLASKLAIAVADRRVISPDAAATMVEARHSSAAPHLDEQEVRRALALATRVTDSIRMGDAKQAWLKQLRELEHLAAPMRDYLHRDPRRNELLFQSCVLAGGLLLKKQTGEAQEQLRSCARIYPGRKPKAAPEVVSAFAAAAAEVAAEPHGSLDVEGGAGCGVRLNGAELGKAPLHVDAVRVGTARIQLECGDTPGRIHGVGIEAGSTNRVRIDPEFDRTLSTTDGLALTYSDAAARDRLMTRHGQLLAGLLDAHIVLLMPAGASTRVLSLQPLAELGTLSGDHVSAEVLHAIAAAMGNPATRAPSATAQLAPESAPSENRYTSRHANSDLYTRNPALRDESGTTPAQTIGGVALVAIGLGGWAAGWVFYAQRAAARASPSWSLSYTSLSDYRSAHDAALWLTAGGGVMFSAAEYLLLPRERGVPTYAWAWGGAGVLLAVSGVALMLAESSCTLPSMQCHGFVSDIAFGQMLALSALPLLAVPLNYALHDWLRPTRRLELGLRGSHLSMSYRF